VTGYVEASIGHDSNVNAGVSQGTLFLPLFGANFTLVPSATQQDDDFRTVGGGIDVSVPIKETLSLVAGADVRQRTYLSSDTFDHLISGLHAGVQHADERDVVRFTAGMNHDELNDRSYRRLQSLNAEWRRQINRRTQFTVYGQDLRIRYPQAGTRSQSSNMLIFGVGGVRTLDEATRSFAFGNVFAGEDDATDQRIDGNRRLFGARVGVQRALRSDTDWYATLGLQRSDYSQENPIFALTRRDWQYDVALGANWRLNDAWSLRPQLAYTRNDATTAINDYDRYELSVTLRRDWR
jgi:hypothetical protein